MGRFFRHTAGPILIFVGAMAFWGCSTAPEKPALPAENLTAVPPPEPAAVAAPAKSAMFDSDPNGEWNIFPDPTTGEVGVYNKGDYVGAIDGDEQDDPPTPHRGERNPNQPDDAPDGYR